MLRVQCILKGWSLKNSLSLVHTQPTTRSTRLQGEGVYSLPITCGHSRPHSKPKFTAVKTGGPTWSQYADSWHLPSLRVSTCSQGPNLEPLSWQHKPHELQCRGHGDNPPAAQRRRDLKIFDGFQQTMKLLAGREAFLYGWLNSYFSSDWDLPKLWCTNESSNAKFFLLTEQRSHNPNPGCWSPATLFVGAVGSCLFPFSSHTLHLKSHDSQPLG